MNDKYERKCSFPLPLSLSVYRPWMKTLRSITSNYRQTWHPHQGMIVVVYSIVKVSMNKIALRIRVGVDDLHSQISDNC